MCIWVRWGMYRRLDHFADIHYGKSPSLVIDVDGTIPVYGTGGIYAHASSPLFPGPAVIVPRKGSLGSPHLATGRFWASDTTYAVIPKSGVDPHWLYYQLCVFELEKLNEATGVPSISRDWLAKIDIADQDVPTQAAAAVQIQCIEQQITHSEALIAKQEQVRAGLMQDLFTRGVDETGRLRPPREEAPELYHETALGWLPKGWETAFLSERAPASGGHLKTGPFGSSLKISHWVEIGHPVITIGSLGVGCFIHDELLFVGSETARRLEGYRVAPGDIVFSRVADVGRSVVVDETSDGWIISSNLMRLRVDSARLRPEIVHLQLAYDPGLRSQLRRTVNSSGREVANAKIMNALRFLSPPMAEQDRVCELARRQQQLIRAEATLLQTLRRQRKALLRDLLTPPASAAAEPRIAAE